MTRRARGDRASAFSMFPFLAVLLCTMGALVVLLVAIANVSRGKAVREAETARVTQERADQGAAADAAQQQLDEANKALEHLQKMRQEALAVLHEEQQRLKSAEEHTRKLEEELEQLQVEAMELARLEQRHGHDQKAARDEIRRLEALINERREEIEELRAEAAERSRRYAIVPLRNLETGTQRPAVYIECSARGITIQPEGVVLPMGDFTPPIERSSPLAAAVRAVSSYYESNPSARAAGEEGAPYPLLVVRPDGVEAYGAASAVLMKIDADYGFQPVAEDWPLEYGAPNPELALQIARAVDMARVTRRSLAAAAPRVYGRRTSGLTLGGGDVSGGGVFSDEISSEQGIGDNPFSGLAGVSTSESGSAWESGDQRYPDTSGEAWGRGASGVESPGVVGTSQTDDQGGAGQDADTPQQVAAAENAGTEEAGQSTSASGQSLVESSNPASASSSSPMGNAASAPEQNANQAPPQLSVNTPQNNAGAETRAQGVKGKSRPGIAIRRTIRVQTYGDRISLLPEEDSIRQGVTIPMATQTEQDWNRVTKELQNWAAGWGIPGDGMYWKPAVVIEPRQGGARHAARLERMFEQAGINVRVVRESTAGAGGSDETTR